MTLSKHHRSPEVSRVGLGMALVMFVTCGGVAYDLGCIPWDTPPERHAFAVSLSIPPLVCLFFTLGGTGRTMMDAWFLAAIALTGTSFHLLYHTAKADSADAFTRALTTKQPTPIHPSWNGCCQPPSFPW